MQQQRRSMTWTPSSRPSSSASSVSTSSPFATVTSPSPSRRTPSSAHGPHATPSSRRLCLHRHLAHASIALNLIRDHTRTDRFRFWKKVSETAVDVSDVSAHIPHRDSSLESRLIASEQITLVWESVGQLSERQRSVFLLRYLEELELSEIADITGLHISTGKTHLYRALATIRARHNVTRKDSL